ncbi:MAG: LacI family DNA-binding transcriptional regulator [Bacillota bacterium]
MNRNDIAKAAKVSSATVSRVINGSSCVAEDTRRKVLKVIEEMSYRPSFAAQSLKKGGVTRQIGLIVNDVTNPYYAEIALGVEETGRKAGYSVVLANSFRGNYLHFCLDGFSRRQVDAVALLSAPTKAEAEYLKKLKLLIEKNIALMAVSHTGTWLSGLKRLEMTVFTMDLFTVAQKAVSYLYGLGHRRIAFITGNDTTEERFLAYKQAHRELGLPLDPSLVLVEKSYKDDQGVGYRGMKKLLDEGKRPSAVFAFNDLVAMGVLRALYEEKIRVPEQVSVIGCDNIMLSAFTCPPLTTIDIPKYKLGSDICAALLNVLKGEKPFHKKVTGELIIRSSTGGCNA